MDRRSGFVFYVKSNVTCPPRMCIWSIADSIFILGLIESNPPRRLSYFFEHDLVAVICLLFRSLFGCRYFIDENGPGISLQHSTNKYIHPQMPHPPLTGYRLLTSISVASFGLVKAGLAYQDFSQAANAVDWISGVLLTSWYVLSMLANPVVTLSIRQSLCSRTIRGQPYRTSAVLVFLRFCTTPAFWYAHFTWHYLSLNLPLGSLVTLHLFGLLLSCVWIGYWIKNVFIPFPDIRAIYNGTDKVYNPVHIAPTTTFQGIHNLTQFIFYIFGSLLIPFMGVICFFVILFNLNENFGGIESLNWVKATYKAIQGIIFSSLSAAFRVARTIRLVKWIKRPFRKLRKSIILKHYLAYPTFPVLFFQRFTLHILVYAFGALLTGIVTFNIIGVLSIFWFEVNPSLFTYLFATYFTIIGAIPLSMVGCLCGYCLMLLVAPFRADWEAPGYERTFFELGG